jgi:hypothetical protein
MKHFAAALTLGLLGPSAVSVAATRVSNDTNCPSSDAISLRLLSLLPAGGPANASARVHADGQSLRIEVATPGEQNRQRTIPAAGDCEAQAEAAAFIIAAWLDAMPVATLATPGLPPREPPARSTRPPESESADEPEARTMLDTHMLVGAGVFGSADTQGASTGLAIEGRMPNLLEGFGWSFESSLGLRREIGLVQGTVRYWRPTFAVAATADLYKKAWVLRAQAGPALGILSASGSGFNVNHQSTTVTWGAIGGIGLARLWRRSEAWLRFDGMAWPQGRRFLVKADVSPSPSTLEASLPDWEVRLTAGFSYSIM